ncbi:histidine kinase [Haloferax mucosum ATCC BAA-1512]|uniref:histidine kinase n=2 Tax=Haloferax mucosum TaxID=403181 RepID=M0IGB4_9EURY|nr:histidine kinase [Haloferax mucosum ATCC BAA-1512]
MVVSILLGVYSLHHIRTNGRSPVLSAFFAVDIGLVLWTGFSALKLLHTDPAVKLAFYRALYLGVAPLGPLVFLFVLVHTDRVRKIRPRLLAVLLSLPFVFLVLLFTNPGGLTIQSTNVVTTADGLVILRVTVGPAHVVLQLLYNAILSIAAVGIILYEAFRLGRSYIQQAVLVSIGIAAPFVFAFCSSLGVPPFNPEGVNLVPTSAAVTALAIGIAIFRYRFLELPPLAYTTAMEASPDSVLVLGPNERIVHVNDRGADFLDRFGSEVGDFVTDVSPMLDPRTPHNDSVRVDNDDVPMFLSVRSQRLVRQNQVVGWVIVLRDVTELHRQKQVVLDQNEKLRLLNQIVRHDIRNDTAVVLGNARLVEEMVDDERARTRLETIIRNSEHTAELTETVRNLMKTMLEDEETSRATSIDGVLWDEATEVRDGNPNATVKLPDERPDATVLADDMLGTVFRNLLTNAIRHNDTPEPTVRISVESRQDDVLVKIADNGPGIPDDRKHEVFGRGEKGFESPGTGLGLYLVDTIVSGYGGDVWVEDNAPRGSVFVVRFEKPESRRVELGRVALNQSESDSDRQPKRP